MSRWDLLDAVLAAGANPDQADVRTTPKHAIHACFPSILSATNFMYGWVGGWRVASCPPTHSVMPLSFAGSL